jgi:hypothetical protein
MSDITDLFSHVAESADAPPTADTVAADLARGKFALRRDHRKRAIRRSLAAAAVVVVAAGAAVTTSDLVGATSHPTAATGPVQTGGTVKLVDYTGKQVPAGWYLSTSTAYALLINPDGATNNRPDVFDGKLAVLTQSIDVPHLPPGTPVTVDGKPGTISDQGKYGLILSYDTDTLGVVIQAPAQLGWSNDQLVAFAEGVHITHAALPGRG